MLEPIIACCRRFLCVAAAGSALALVGCGITPVSRPPGQVTGPAPARVPDAATTIPLGREDSATSPWDYIAAARNAASPERERLTLDAIELFLDLRQVSTAQTLLEQLQPQTMPAPLARRHRLLATRALLLAGQPQRAVQNLEGISGAGLDRAAVSEVLRLRGESLVAMNELERGIADLSRRSDFLDDDESRLRSSRRIWEILQSQRLEDLTRIRDQRAADTPIVSGWADLALVTAQNSWDPRAMSQQLERWAQLHPGHPAGQQLVPELIRSLTSTLRSYDRVALLLPMTSEYETAARAVYDGIVSLHESDSNPRKPQLILYDFGNDPAQVSFYYQAAIRDGVDFVIGPLGKAAADSLVRTTAASVPTLLLGTPEPSAPIRGPYYQFSLAPELEGSEVAERAFEDGHRAVAILGAGSEQGQSIADAMARRFEGLGGVVAIRREFAPAGSDHSQAIQLMLNLHESQARGRRIEALAGQPLQFEPRRRHDIDAILLVADSNQARLVKPQLDFFQAHDLPIYATSQVYAGRPDPVNDLDLDGIVFGDMPWVLRDSGQVEIMRSSLPASAKYRNSALDRLFALGMDAYAIMPRLEQLAGASFLRHRGFTGVLTINSNGLVERDLTWARFNQARPVPIPDAGRLPAAASTRKEHGKETAPSSSGLVGRDVRLPAPG
jgi:hypothetical protein